MTCQSANTGRHHHCISPRPARDPQYASIFHAFWDTLREMHARQKSAHGKRPRRSQD